MLLKSLRKSFSVKRLRRIGLCFGLLVGGFLMVSDDVSAQSERISQSRVREYIQGALNIGFNPQKWRDPITLAVIGRPMESFWPQLDQLVDTAQRVTGHPIMHVKVPSGSRANGVTANVLIILTDNVAPYLDLPFIEERFKRTDESVDAYRTRITRSMENGAWQRFRYGTRQGDGGEVTDQVVLMARMLPDATSLPALFEANFLNIFVPVTVFDTDVPTALRRRRGDENMKLSALDWAFLSAYYAPEIKSDRPVDEILEQLTALMAERLPKVEAIVRGAQ